MTNIPTHTTDDTMILIDPVVNTTAAKPLKGVARRYHLPEGAVDDRPQVDLPKGTRIRIDGIWEGGYLSAHYDQFDFPVSHDEVEQGLYERLSARYGPDKMHCPNCDGGWREVYEDDRQYREPCYTCASTGFINEDQYFGLRFRDACAMLGSDLTEKTRRARNEHPDGEGWEFCAAENGLSEYDFTQLHAIQDAEKVEKALSRLGEDNTELLRVLVDRLVPMDSSLRAPKKEVESDKPVEEAQPKQKPNRCDDDDIPF